MYIVTVAAGREQFARNDDLSHHNVLRFVQVGRSHSRDRLEPRYTVRLSRHSGEWVARRARRSGAVSVAQQIAADVATLADVLAAEARRIPLTLAEARALRDAAGDGNVAPGAGRVLLGALVDWIEIARDSGAPVESVYGLDEEMLTRKVRSLGHAGDLAIREAVAAWRAAGLPDTAAGYREAGLNVVEPTGADGQEAG